MHLALGLARGISSAFVGTVELTVVTLVPANGMNDSVLPFTVVRQPNLATLIRLVHKADVVHLAGPLFLPMILGILLRKPVVIEHHGFQAICPNGQLFYEPSCVSCPGHFMAGRHEECLRCNAEQGKWQSLKAWSLTFPRRWLCHGAFSNIMPTDWLASLVRLPRMITIRHGLTEVSPQPLERVDSPVPTFGFLGRLVTTKGARVLIEAASILRLRGCSFRVKIVGDGPDRRALEDLVGDLKLKTVVQFMGYLPNDSIEENLRNCCAIIMPSLAGEVFGLVAAEAMQRGQIVIVSDVGALREVVGPNGLTFPAGNSSALADCMERVIVTPGLGEQLGARAQQRILEHFSAREMIERHFMVYARAAAR
jgi:glycosyltransferase involved in cell wall biosynthesis